ncbi:hypothetical protein [Thalassoroseus pseudoceratinae]|uniref:hypothetical protein n=1 Tax=Thalassoroseus pseudoceratinae TaxID=2713176 RepID=UPI001421773A|nr:hypothetical protein [Thalassoroseus pseudoceratinae]
MAANKPTAVHFSLIFFVMATIILGVFTYIFLDEGRELRSQLTAMQSERDTQKQVALNNAKDVESLKQVLGYPDLQQVGDPAAPQPGTVLSALAEDLQNTAGPGAVGPKTVKEGLADLRTNLNTATSDFSTAKAENARLASENQTIDTQARNEATTYKNAATQSEQEKQATLAEHKAEQTRLRGELTKAQQSISERELRIQQLQQAHAQEIAGLNRRISDLNNTNEDLRRDLEDVRRVSFERPDGKIQWVDNTSHLVWINIGEAEGLEPRTTFSIYEKGNRGVGRASEDIERGPEDIKGAIEVTRILGAHSAEARIVSEDIYNPIAIDDPIYSPAWGPNQTMKFAFVGLIDPDGDGQSDRQILKDAIQASGAEDSIWVDDQGNRTGGDIDSRTKFLVVGDIPDPANIAEPSKIEAAKAIQAAYTTMEQEARERGVRIISLNDFMAFIGFTPKQRVFRPGEQRPFTLRSGARPTSTNTDTSRRRSNSPGSIYGNGKSLKPATTGRAGATASGY